METFIFLSCDSQNTKIFKTKIIQHINKLTNNNRYIICADSGTNLIYPKIIPDLIIGDFDSISPKVLCWAVKNNVSIIKYPRDKDYTDFHLALEHAFTKRLLPTKVTIFGGLSNRLDQTLANVLLISSYSTKYKVPISMHEHKTNLYILNNEVKKINLKNNLKNNDTISLIPIFNDIKIKVAKGLRYEIYDEILPINSTIGISNEVVQKNVTIEIDNGTLAIIHISQ